MDLHVGHTARETWLQEAVGHMADWFGAGDVNTVPTVRVACGWAKRASAKSIGWCWKTEVSGDGVNEIQISPEIEDPVTVLATLLHEMVHASDDGESKHAGYFRRAALALGLTGKMTATVPGDELRAKLAGMAEWLGPYPHAAINPSAASKDKQTTRMIKVQCPHDDCGYLVRTTQKWIEVGNPTCPCGTVMEIAS